jgi:hypothetical protein
LRDRESNRPFISIRVNIANQVRQTTVLAWRPLLPLFEAVMNSFQAIKEVNLPANIPGRITIEVKREGKQQVDGTAYLCRETGLPLHPRLDRQIHFALEYNQDLATKVFGGHDLPDPEGMSGSLVWNTRFVECAMDVWPGPCVARQKLQDRRT